MPSTYTSNLGIELPADGELDGIWGDVVNDNMGILDRAINGSVSLSLSGTSSTLTTSDGILSNGQYKLLALSGSPSGTHTITIAPNDAQKVYFVYNTTAQSVVFTQGSGGNVTIAAGDSGIIYSNGGGASAAVVNLTDHFAMSSVKITGGSISGAAITGGSINVPTATFSGDLLIADKIVHDGDINTSIRFPVADTVTVETNGLERMRVHASGGVSVGNVTDPGAVNLSVSGTIFLPAATTEARGVEIGANRTGNGSSYVDLIGDATYTDYGARFVRENTGPNALTNIVHRGTGTLKLVTEDAAPITFATSLIDRMRVHASGGVSIGGVTDPGANNLSITGTTLTTGMTINGGTQSWTVIASGTNLTFAYNGVNRMRLDGSTGNITVTGNVTAFGTI